MVVSPGTRPIVSLGTSAIGVMCVMFTSISQLVTFCQHISAKIEQFLGEGEKRSYLAPKGAISQQPLETHNDLEERFIILENAKVIVMVTLGGGGSRACQRHFSLTVFPAPF